MPPRYLQSELAFVSSSCLYLTGVVRSFSCHPFCLGLYRVSQLSLAPPAYLWATTQATPCAWSSPCHFACCEFCFCHLLDLFQLAFRKIVFLSCGKACEKPAASLLAATQILLALQILRKTGSSMFLPDLQIGRHPVLYRSARESSN